MDKHPIQEEEILLVTSCYRNRDNLPIGNFARMRTFKKKKKRRLFLNTKWRKRALKRDHTNMGEEEEEKNKSCYFSLYFCLPLLGQIH